jgi:galactonate dehydratase
MFLKIETDEGVVGWGKPVIESDARTVEATVQEFADMLVSPGPARINDLWMMMYGGGFYRGGAILISAIAGIDQALWDIMGKVLGVSAHELLGLGARSHEGLQLGWAATGRPKSSPACALCARSASIPSR